MFFQPGASEGKTELCEDCSPSPGVGLAATRRLTVQLKLSFCVIGCAFLEKRDGCPTPTDPYRNFFQSRTSRSVPTGHFAQPTRPQYSVQSWITACESDAFRRSKASCQSRV